MKSLLSAEPGRATRKARGYGADILRLRSQGCTFEAIRAALAEVGVRVSKSTVQREAARTESPVITAVSVPKAVDMLTLASASHDLEAPAKVAAAQAKASGKDIADAFFARNHFNPLLPKD